MDFYRSTSSPPSSPSVCVDSSPPSSPIPDYNLDSDGYHASSDPFAGSFKAVHLPSYEKKRPISPILDSPIPKKTRFQEPPSPQFSDNGAVQRILLPQEERICETAINEAFKNSHLNIDLECVQVFKLPVL